jgi:hypothetical protein
MLQENIRSFLSRQGHYIGRKTPSFTLRPVRDNMFSSLHYVPDGTLVTGGTLLSTDMLSPAGQKAIFFRPDFSKKTNITFLRPIWG